MDDEAGDDVVGDVHGSLGGAGDAPMLDNTSNMDDPPMEVDLSHPFVSALQFDLVTKQLMSFINFEDMKALSRVSAGCLQAVRKSDEFSKRARLIVCKEVVTAGVLKESVYQWKNLSLDLSLPVEVVELIADILDNVTSLTLRLPDVKDDQGTVHYLTQILKITNNLKILELDALIFNHVLHDVFSNVEVQAVLTNLQCLAIQSHCDKPNSICYVDGSEDESDIPFQRNFLQLSEMPLRLKKFVFGKVLTLSSSESEHVKFIPRILETTKATLEDLELHLQVWKSEEMNVIRCPKLKRLVLSANGDEKSVQKTVKTFIKNQPPLEQLVISMNKEFPLTILLALEGVVTKMKKLHIKAKFFSETSVPVDWGFLQGLSELKDFRIRKPYTRVYRDDKVYGLGEDFLTKLPNGIEKISLEGFDLFWKEPYPIFGNIGECLTRFENLTEINLLRSANALTDDGLQSIIMNCKKLGALTFSHCPEVTDYGISGIRKTEDGSVDEQVGVSLKDLKGLVRLKIRSCPNITSDCLLNVVEFRFLRCFDYYRNVQLPKTFLLQIAKQNPCLEEVSLHITSYDNNADYLKELRKEVKEINPRIHLMGILEQSDWEDNDSDSDSSSLPGDGDSDFSGGGYHVDNYDDLEDVDDDYYESPDDFVDGFVEEDDDFF